MERNASECHREGHFQHTTPSSIGLLERYGTQDLEGPDTGTDTIPSQPRGVAILVRGTETGEGGIAKRNYVAGLGDKDPNYTREKGDGTQAAMHVDGDKGR